MAGADVLNRFSTAFAGSEQLDASATSRFDLWWACWDLMITHPLGIGPDNFGLVVQKYGFPPGKLAHSVWLQVGAELGFAGLGFLILFYGLCIFRLLPMARERRAAPDPWFYAAARMVIAALVGFIVSGQFVSLKGLELPFYVVLVGAATLKLCSGHGAVRAIQPRNHTSSVFKSARREGAGRKTGWPLQPIRVL
jgi:O-antigen ligase